MLNHEEAPPIKMYKMKLQELCHKRRWGLPKYSIMKDVVDVATLNAQSHQGDNGRGSRDKDKAHQFDDEEQDVPWWIRNPSRRNHTKMEFPKFEGGDPRGWILKAEKYFRYYQTPEELKVDIAAMYLEGDALDLFAWMNGERIMLYWEELVKALQENYDPAEFQNPDEHFFRVKQVGTVQDYRKEFAKRAARVKNWPEHCLLGVFLSGLKDELVADVRIQKPRSVYKALSLTLEYEAKIGPTMPNKETHYNAPRRIPNFSSWPNKFQTQSISGFGNMMQSASSSNITPTAAMKPWEAECQARRDKGPCTRCGDRFFPGHRCKASLSLLEIGDGDGMEEENDGGSADPSVEETEDVADLAEISLHAILGKYQGSTMKIKGTMASKSVLILIDSGSTHNFISETLVQELRLPVQQVPTFGVQIGNGEVIRCNTICRGIKVKLQGLQLVQDCYPFALGGADMVLGIKWLASLNMVQANWNEMFMIFELNGKKYKLQGIPHLQNNPASLQSLLASTEPEIRNTIPTQIQPIIQHFEGIFTEPNSLPPFRTHTHTIPLLPNSKTPNIRPYRFPYYQKNEIEAQWSTKAENAFQNLKKALTTVSVLSMPDFHQPFVVECDASADGVGAVLTQQGHPIAYFSKAGKENKGADALSRKPQHADFLSLAIPFPLDFASLQNDLSKDDFTEQIIRELQQNPTAYPEFQLVQGMLYYNDRLYFSRFWKIYLLVLSLLFCYCFGIYWVVTRVSLNGLTFDSLEPSTSSKHALNLATKLAFLYFTSSSPPSQLTAVAYLLPLSGSVYFAGKGNWCKIPFGATWVGLRVIQSHEL
ncbi:Ty3/gypsy retrotransposon protein [Senna tora]|uniref:Ty3/gypsy retrotransposon protein n=1 Tax=Senna tora TaxID=362788 RepID=A0A834WBC4_9FABA|nr:Ty3/gypsy retrotransposon protein [Senna tora]